MFIDEIPLGFMVSGTMRFVLTAFNEAVRIGEGYLPQLVEPKFMWKSSTEALFVNFK